MPYTSRNAERQPSPVVSGTPFRFRRPKVDTKASPRELVQILKRLITEAREKAIEAEMAGDNARLANIRLARAYSSQRLRDVVDEKVPKKDVEGNLRQALNVLINTLY